MSSELELRDGDARALVAPARGGMVTAWSVGGREIFFLDRATFLDPTKNVRGGNPVLFPTPGKLASDAWSRDGQSGALGQHGFARNRAFEVVREGMASVTLRLASDEKTRADYPWDFELDLTYRVAGRSLFTTARVANRSTSSMPFGFGFHPYFAVKDKRSFTIETSASRAFDNVTKRDVPFDRSTLDVGASEIDLHLLDHDTRELGFTLDGASLLIDGGVERPQWVLWSLPGKDFVCVEPWTCPGNAMNTGDRLMALPSGASSELAFEYRAL